MTTYTVPRAQGTYADTLQALGLGRLLEALSEQGEVVVRLNAAQDAFTLEVAQPITLPNGTPPTLYDYIKTDRDGNAPPDAFDYEGAKDHRQRFFKWRENNKRASLDDMPEGIHLPRPDYSLYSSLVDMLKPLDTSGYAAAHRELASQRFGEHIGIALEVFSSDGLPLEKAEAGLKKRLKGNKANEVSIVQIFNPMTGKGMNSPKANSIGMNQAKAPLVLEALKYTGWFVGAVAVTPRGSKDLKVLVVQPTDIELETLRQVMNAFRRDFMGGGAIQVDILAALILTETLLKYHESQEADWLTPMEALSGFQIAYFQNLGSAKGVTNISFIALPAWVRLDGDEAEKKRQLWLDVLKEHRQVIRNLDESHSEERNLLEKYRDFLSGQDVRAFLEFLSDYGPHALRLADRGKYALWMTTENLGRVLNNMERNDITSIITNSGFQSVAGAIRRATRTALYTRKLSGDRTYDVHYGLAQELKRSAVTKPKFMAALADFVAEYMTENLRAADRGKRGRAPVTTEDLLEIGRLLDEHDPQMVAMLLIAYGYAKEPREETPEPEATTQPEPNVEEQE
ncbi:hypothetical protein DAERI_070002 [Deinococcus aerius]|uniref:Uncharacterized protein n=1 Tax=Deinococcus aerius TaxID=200253 RepID=A0A2I9CVM7_9DEIO|nr:hypothetical protein [Deinococcus aerius]GBF06004.1 hypothetical protein DAERI_070002 [Deinococcus aerius]